MKRHLLFSLFTLLLVLLGGVNVSVQAEVTKPDDTQKYPFSVSGVDYDQKFETWDALKEGIKKGSSDISSDKLKID